MHLKPWGICLMAIFVCSLRAIPTRAADAETMLLWPQGAPGAKGHTDNDKPTLTSYIPEKQDQVRAAVIVCPGGGYSHLAMGHEGEDVAKWLNSLGVTAFVLK